MNDATKVAGALSSGKKFFNPIPKPSRLGSEVPNREHVETMQCVLDELSHHFPDR